MFTGGIRGERNVNDGFFEIRFFDDGVYLTVYPPEGKGKAVDVDEVLNKLQRKKVKNYDRKIVNECVAKANKVPAKIAEPQQEEILDAQASVFIAPDRMKAFLALLPPEGGRMLTKDELLNILKENGVIFGINDLVLESIVINPVYGKMICVAEGVPPVDGKNGSVEFYFNIKKEAKPRILADGSVDFRELNIVENVRKGQKLCTLIPPENGTPGKTVLGTDIPAKPGKPASLPRGKNVEPDEDGQSLIASIDGQVEYSDEKVNVYATYEVHADVDNSTGNITFIGNIIIKGNVLSGFTVEAGGNVEVWGVVEGAVIKAGGDIVLRRGMQGLGKGILVCGGDIIARYIENSNIEAGNDIKAEAIMHSNVKCGNKLELSGRKGLLVGGTCKVGKEIEAKVIGSYMATSTDIEVGVDPRLREKYKQVKDEISAVENDLKKSDQAINLLKKLQIAGMLTEDKENMLNKALRTKIFLTNKLVDLKEELSEIEVALQQDSFGKIKVYNYIYPGVKVTIGTSSMRIRENLQYCTLYRDGADIRVGPID
ncbi:MAG TPA: DUF342 domain-containing protein [Clostridiaceae bacterium]|nr:DUF342 domain-containing protein [Clostridiaceae bacterium]HHV99068.1 DUF342 domain-containing protein [Clostridiaceae bacterium]